MWKISKILTLLGTANRSHMIMVYHIISTSEQVIDNQFANRWNSAMTFAATQLVGLRKAERTGWVQVAGASSASVTQCSMGIKSLMSQGKIRSYDGFSSFYIMFITFITTHWHCILWSIPSSIKSICFRICQLDLAARPPIEFAAECQWQLLLVLKLIELFTIC